MYDQNPRVFWLATAAATAERRTRPSSSSSSDKFDGWGDDTEEEEQEDDEDDDDDGAVYDWTVMDTAGKKKSFAFSCVSRPGAMLAGARARDTALYKCKGTNPLTGRNQKKAGNVVQRVESWPLIVEGDQNDILCYLGQKLGPQDCGSLS